MRISVTERVTYLVLIIVRTCFYDLHRLVAKPTGQLVLYRLEIPERINNDGLLNTIRITV